MQKHILNIFMALSLVGLLGLVSCESDFDTTEVDNFTSDSSFGADYDQAFGSDRHGGQRNDGCIELVFPISFTYSDGTVIDAANKEDLRDAIRAYHEANPDVRERPEITFPIEVINQDDEVITVNSSDELQEIVEACREGRRGGHGGQRGGPGFGDCVEMVFPITFTFSDGTVIDAASQEDLRDAIRAYHEANPDVRERPEISFPIEVINQDDEVITVNNSDELQEIIEVCREGRRGGHGGQRGGHGFGDCVELVFPITFTFSDGTVIDAASQEDLRDAIGAYHEANPDVRERPEISFPIEVINQDDEVITVNSSDELQEIIEACREGRRGGHGGQRGGHGFGDCVELVFPITFTFSDGTVIDAASQEDLRDAIRAYHEANPDVRERPEISFPIEVINQDDEVLTVNSAEEFHDIIEACRG